MYPDYKNQIKIEQPIRQKPFLLLKTSVMAESKPEHKDSLSDKDVKAPNLIERAKEEMEAIKHTEKSPYKHDKETHGTSDDIDENTPIDAVKGPSVFERAKEEVEALVEAIIPKKKESENHDSPSKKEGGFFASIGRSFEKVCSPKDKKRSL